MKSCEHPNATLCLTYVVASRSVLHGGVEYDDHELFICASNLYPWKVEEEDDRARLLQVLITIRSAAAGLGLDGVVL